MGFTSWSEVIKSGESETNGLFNPDEIAAEEEFRLCDHIPIPVSVDDGKTLDWSQPVDSEASARAPIRSGPIVRRE